MRIRMFPMLIFCELRNLNGFGDKKSRYKFTQMIRMIQSRFSFAKNHKPSKNETTFDSRMQLCFFLIQLSTTVYSLQCPVNITKECSCVDRPKFVSNYSKNNESISMIFRHDSEFVRPIEFECGHFSDGEILKTINFNFIHNRNAKELEFKSCPLSSTFYCLFLLEIGFIRLHCTYLGYASL